MLRSTLLCLRLVVQPSLGPWRRPQAARRGGGAGGWDALLPGPASCAQGLCVPPGAMRGPGRSLCPRWCCGSLSRGAPAGRPAPQRRPPVRALWRLAGGTGAAAGNSGGSNGGGAAAAAVAAQQQRQPWPGGAAGARGRAPGPGHKRRPAAIAGAAAQPAAGAQRQRRRRQAAGLLGGRWCREPGGLVG